MEQSKSAIDVLPIFSELTTPNQITWDRSLIVPLLACGAMPIIGILAVQFPPLLQFWEAAQQSSQLAGFQKLLIAFVPAAEFEKFASHALAGGTTLVVAYTNVLLDIYIGERGDNNLSLLVVLDQSNSHELNIGQQKLLPVVIAAMLKLLRAPQIVEFSDADLVSSECISQLRQVKGDSVHVRSAVERIRSGPFDLSQLDLAIVANLKKMFVRGAIPMQVDSRIDPCSTPSQPTQETIIVPPDKVFFFSERGLFDAPPLSSSRMICGCESDARKISERPILLSN